MDGMSAAYAAHLSLGDEATYLALNHDEPIPEFGESRSFLYWLDIAPKRDVYNELIKTHHVKIIDHHISSLKVYDDIKTHHDFDMNHSGAVLAWKHFHPKEDIPDFFLYIEDRDLWRKALPGSEAFTAAIMNKPKNISTYHDLARTDIKQLIAEGERLLEENKYMLRDILRNHHLFTKIDGELVPIVNSNVLMSDVANLLLEKYPDAKLSAYFGIQNDGNVKIGLRSNDKYDVSLMASKRNGGGHKNAAGFTMSLEEFYEKIPLLNLN